jgi:glutaconate CoA-transferase subunit A
MTDKRLTEDEVVAQLRSGMTVAIGGWGSRRKPMSMVRAILRSDLTDLTIVSHGGPDLGLLCAAGKVRRAIYAFVSLDQSTPGHPPAALLEPHFRKARQSGAIEDEPLDECRSCPPGSASGRTCGGTTPGWPPSARRSATARS